MRIPGKQVVVEIAQRAAEGERASAYRAGDVVHDDGRGRAAVVHGGEGVVLLLAGGIPDLELDRLIVHN